MNRATSEKGKNLGTDQQSGPSDALSEIAPELFFKKVRFRTKSPIFGHDESSEWTFYLVFMVLGLEVV